MWAPRAQCSVVRMLGLNGNASGSNLGRVMKFSVVNSGTLQVELRNAFQTLVRQLHFSSRPLD